MEKVKKTFALQNVKISYRVFFKQTLDCQVHKGYRTTSADWVLVGTGNHELHRRPDKNHKIIVSHSQRWLNYITVLSTRDVSRALSLLQSCCLLSWYRQMIKRNPAVVFLRDRLTAIIRIVHVYRNNIVVVDVKKLIMFLGRS